MIYLVYSSIFDITDLDSYRRDVMDYESLYKVETTEETLTALEDEDLIHFIGLIKPTMPGIIECLTLLEYRDYPIGTARNDILQIRMFGWLETLWTLITLPKEDRHFVEKAATEFDLNVIGGIPIQIAKDKFRVFPVQGANVFCLLMNKDHPARKDNPQINAAYEDSIGETLERIRGEYKNSKPLN